MPKTWVFASAELILLSAGILCSGALQADEQPAVDRLGRIELWLGTSSWPALQDLEPVAAGSFDSAGFGLGGSLHVQVKAFDNSQLLLGIDAFIHATESNIPGIINDLMARQLYFGGSAKWRFGVARNFMLDAGLGLHLIDIADVDTSYLGTAEFETWETTRPGLFVGATWDIQMNSPEKTRGFFVALKVHFVDFGTVYDEDTLTTPVLGPNAGKLDGPIYMLQIGYGGI